MTTVRTLVACHATLLAALVPAVALAHEGDHGPGGGGSGSSEAQTQSASVTASEPEHVAAHEKLAIDLDWVMGFGKLTTVEQAFPSSTQFTPTNVIVSAPYRSQSYTLSGRLTVGSVGIGLRVPMVIGTIRGASTHITGDDVFNLGNVALSIDVPKKLSETLTVIPELQLALPTAEGNSTPTPAHLASVVPNTFDRYASYQYAANLAAAMAHGYEDDALFLSRRLGVVPRVGLTLRTGSVSFDPYVKVPVMFDTHSDSDERVRLEVVAGARLAADVTPWLQPGVRVFGTVPLAGVSGMLEPSAVVEPQLRFHSDNTFSVTVGGILPFAGGLTDPTYMGAVRATVAAAF